MIDSQCNASIDLVARLPNDHFLHNTLAQKLSFNLRVVLQPETA